MTWKSTCRGIVSSSPYIFISRSAAPISHLSLRAVRLVEHIKTSGRYSSDQLTKTDAKDEVVLALDPSYHHMIWHKAQPPLAELHMQILWFAKQAWNLGILSSKKDFYTVHFLTFQTSGQRCFFVAMRPDLHVCADTPLLFPRWIFVRPSAEGNYKLVDCNRFELTAIPD